MKESLIKKFLRYILASLMVFAGASHFLRPELFIAIVPAYLPHPALLVYISGAAEMLGGIGLLIPRFQKAAAWGLIALFIAVFPANINMAVNDIPFGNSRPPAFVAWARLPFQAVLILWAWWFTKDSAAQKQQ